MLKKISAIILILSGLLHTIIKTIIIIPIHLCIFQCMTPVIPELDEGYRATLEKLIRRNVANNNYSSYNSYWKKNKNAWFQDDSTGEAIGVSVFSNILNIIM